MKQRPHTPIAHLHGSRWDVVIVGAGLAGTLAALLIVRNGLRVLLVDAKPFPRDKVCGGCLNGRAVSVLLAAGLDALQPPFAGEPLRRIEFVQRSRQVALAVTGGIAISRRALDQALVNAAVDAGAVFYDGCAARLCPLVECNDRPETRSVRLTSFADEAIVSAGCVAIADGLNRPSLSDCTSEFPFRIAPRSWMGLGTTINSASGWLPQGLLRMAIGAEGYVGAVRFAAGNMTLAAAVNGEFLRRYDSPASAIESLYQSAGVEVPAGVTTAKWNGTGRLTRRSLRVAGHRTLLIGDAAGYVEPFTGEGMTWALTSAVEAAPILTRGIRKWPNELTNDWEQRFRQQIRRRQFWCRGLSLALHRPWLVSGCLSLAGHFPALPNLIAASINQPVSVWKA